MASEPLGDRIFTVENLICFGILALCFYSFFILIGTSMPLLSGIFLPKPTSVKEAFYNNLSIPFGICILAFIPLSTLLLTSKKINIKFILSVISGSIFLGVVFNLLHTKNFFAYIFTIMALFLIIIGIIDLIKLRTSVVLSSRLSHIGVGLLVIGVITSNLHSYSIKKKLIANEEKDIKTIHLTFKGLTKSKKSFLTLVLRDGKSKYDITAPYYMDKITNSLYREPYILYGLFYDIYISPEEYRSGINNASRHYLSKGVVKNIGAMEVEFTGFNTGKMVMKSGEGIISAKIALKIRGRKYRVMPGVSVARGKITNTIDSSIPNSSRKISLHGIDVRAQEILLYIEPGKEDSVPPDSLIVDVSFKRLIWFVWMGTLFIAFGGIFALKRRF